MTRLTRHLVFLVFVLVPAIAFAATTSNQDEGDFILKALTLVMSTYTASCVGPLTKRVARVEERQDALEREAA